jgi:hypothetical protein
MAPYDAASNMFQAVARGRKLEQAGNYSGAVDAYLELTVGAESDHNVLEVRPRALGFDSPACHLIRHSVNPRVLI